jgi:hypothetical protein
MRALDLSALPLFAAGAAEAALLKTRYEIDSFQAKMINLYLKFQHSKPYQVHIFQFPTRTTQSREIAVRGRCALMWKSGPISSHIEIVSHFLETIDPVFLLCGNFGLSYPHNSLVFAR